MIIYQKRINRDDLKLNPGVLYLFGDNDVRSGRGGQAASCRGEPNAIGIRTKKKPTTDPYAYWNDREYEKNIDKIDKDFEPVIALLRRGGVVVVPSDGIGTGMAKMQENCPRTFDYLQRKLQSLSEVGRTI